MCLIIFAFEHHPKYQLILAANRDEFYDRPTRPLAYWKDCPQLLAGRDEKAGGTWLAVAHSSRVAAITNYRDPDRVRADAPSRGDLVRNFVVGDFTSRTYATRIQHRAHRYNGFNLLLYDGYDLVYYGSPQERVIALEPGFYGLSNHLLDTPWPKVTRAKALLAPMLAGQSPLEAHAVLKLLGDRHQPADQQLPDTGVGITWERILAPIFITSPTYGTRSSSLVCVGRNGRTAFSERTYTPNHSPKRNYSDRHFTLTW